MLFRKVDGERIRRLYDGDMSDYLGTNGKPDHSRADQALCNALAYATGKDSARMDSMFRQSGLYRADKWERQDYRDRTINEAIMGTHKTYDPSYRSKTPALGNPAGVIDMHKTNGATAQATSTGTAKYAPGMQIIWRNGAGDLPGTITGIMGQNQDTGEWFYQVDSEHMPGNSGIPESELIAPTMELAQVDDAKNKSKRTKQPGYTWTDYVAAAERLGYAFSLNDLDDRIEVNGERLTDVAEAELLSYLHAEGLKQAEVARRAFVTAAARNRYHPVRRYFEALQWDGRDHITHLANHFTDNHPPITYTNGTQRTVIHAWLLRWLIGAVAKVLEAGRAQNSMLILDGAQGKGKSYFAKWICPLPELQFEGAIKPEDKDYFGYLTSSLVWEVSELGATMRKTDQEALKALITMQDATWRPSYGRHPLHKPAMASFIGTVNFDGELLSDPTGHRRFHPVELTAIDWGYSTTIDVNQLWAQALALYRKGEPPQLTQEERAVHQVICERYAVEDVLTGYIHQWFDVRANDNTLYTHTATIIDHLRTHAGAKGTDRSMQMRLASTLNKHGLRKERRNDMSGYVGIEPRETRRP
jgi:predicted P-loop ATPase